MITFMIGLICNENNASRKPYSIAKTLICTAQNSPSTFLPMSNGIFCGDRISALDDSTPTFRPTFPLIGRTNCKHLPAGLIAILTVLCGDSILGAMQVQFANPFFDAFIYQLPCLFLHSVGLMDYMVIATALHVYHNLD